MDIINTEKLCLAFGEIRCDLISNAVKNLENSNHSPDDLELVLNLAKALPDLKLNQLSEYSDAIGVLHQDFASKSVFSSDLAPEIYKLSELAGLVTKIEHHLSIDDFEIFSDFEEYIKNMLLESGDIPDLVIQYTDWEAVAAAAALDYSDMELSAKCLFNMDVTTFYWRK